MIRSTSDHQPSSWSWRCLSSSFLDLNDFNLHRLLLDGDFCLSNLSVICLRDRAEQIKYSTSKIFGIEIPKTSHWGLLVSRPRAIKRRIRWVDYVSICRISAVIGSCTIYLVNGDGGPLAQPWYDAPISRSRHSCPVQTRLNDSPGATLGAICNKSRLSPELGGGRWKVFCHQPARPS